MSVIDHSPEQNMIIHLERSDLFTVDPAIRFGKEYNVPPRVWNEMWRMYCLKPLIDEASFDKDHEDFLVGTLKGYLTAKTGRLGSSRSIRRWILRTEIYCRAQHVIGMGVRVVDSAYFGQFEQSILDELLKGMRFSGTHDSRSVV